MKKSISLSIPQPCGEDWNSFTPTDTGGFCSSCSKNVIDFTHASDAEIINFFTHEPVAVCGRFRADQLKTYPLLPSGSIKPGFVLLRAGVLSLLLLWISKPGTAQAPADKIKTESVQHPQRDTANAGSPKEVRITGVVTAKEDDSALPGVSVVQRGTSLGTQTDGKGQFELRMDPAKGNVLVFSFIGLATQEITLRPNQYEYNIALKADITGRMEVLVVAGLVGPGRPLEHKDLSPEKPRFLRKVWTNIKNIF